MKLLKFLGFILLAGLALTFWPFAIGGGLAWYLWKKRKIQNVKLRYSIIAVSLLFAVIAGTSWIIALNTNSSNTNQPQAAVSKSANSLLSYKIIQTLNDYDNKKQLSDTTFYALENPTFKYDESKIKTLIDTIKARECKVDDCTINLFDDQHYAQENYAYDTWPEDKSQDEFDSQYPDFDKIDEHHFVAAYFSGKLLYYPLIAMRSVTSTPFNTQADTPQTNSANSSYCPSSPLLHVYNPQRLQIINNCMEVSGTVEAVRSEADGDYHINIRLDSPYSNLINDKNVSGEHGDLVVETVCEHSVTQADAESTCANFHSDVFVPSVGNHVFVVGPYVLDKDHGWMEIHPASYIGSSNVNVTSQSTEPIVPNTNSQTTNTSSTTSNNSTTQVGQPTGKCKDGTETYATNHQGACSHHGGVAVWY